MERRRYLVLTGTVSSVALAGCLDTADRSEATESGVSNSETTTTEIDTGVVYDGTLSTDRDWFVTVRRGQTVTVTVGNVASGEELLLKIGDGTAFVHSYTFTAESESTNEYTVESDGRHQVRLSPGRADPPVNEDVSVSVRIELGTP